MTTKIISPYQLKHPVRILTAGSLFDGHDAAINIMRRVMQRSGAEIIHLGHNRSVAEIIDAAIQEDVQGIAITSYQGGHLEFFKYAHDLLKEKGAGHIKLFGGGGGTILPTEIMELEAYGIAKIFSPDDGRAMGLQGMINHVLEACDVPSGLKLNGEVQKAKGKDHLSLGKMISAIENLPEGGIAWIDELRKQSVESNATVLGITGTGGAGKSSLIDELILRYLRDFPEHHIGIISVDPSKRKTGGALLGDRIRMNAIHHPQVFMRSVATRAHHQALSDQISDILNVLKYAQMDLIILESSGIGQSGSQIVDYVDTSIYVMTPEFGAATQLEKIDMLDFAELVVINKFDKRGAADALKAVKKQYQRNNDLWDQDPARMPVYGTMASQFNDEGMNAFYQALVKKLYPDHALISNNVSDKNEILIIPPKRVRYLSEITDCIRNFDKEALAQSEIASKLYVLNESKKLLNEAELQGTLDQKYESIKQTLKQENQGLIDSWESLKASYKSEHFTYKVRDKEFKVDNFTTSLSQNLIPKISLPNFRDWGDILLWQLKENVPGKFPYTAGVFPFKRKGEDPTRMFAGEGGPERTNKRFHYLAADASANRLSTAFDSVTLYGEDPDHRPDIYGKVGNSGVSICSLDDAKKLYSGFDLCDPKTSVSMTINGPAATICAFFMNAAIDQECEKYIKAHGLEGKVEQKLKEKYDHQGLERPAYHSELPATHHGLGLMLLGITGDEVLDQDVYASLKEKALASVRGTVQADILKEDQAQNTCIFSTEFSLKLMGDMQAYFIDHQVRNFYSVSISGYHIAEAGANPITQLAFTLANGFTFIEYYLSRGMDIDDFAPNLSFFFSNGIDPEYAVIGRVARRIWAKAMKYLYKGNSRSQKLKYHIQTSGRSLHAQEISFNDIRTTLQALYAIYDNCNSLHTNAYDEAITTPTEESVRRAVAIQMIINHELGLSKNENPLQGSFIIEELTDLVEEAVLTEFDRLNDRGGVLGAMEHMYQRNKIQEESLHYESMKHSGAYPIMGVNTFLSKDGSPTLSPPEVIRASSEEKLLQIENLQKLQRAKAGIAKEKLQEMQQVALSGQNIFETLMETTKHCSLGQITHAMFEIGGKYRRNM